MGNSQPKHEQKEPVQEPIQEHKPLKQQALYRKFPHALALLEKHNTRVDWIFATDDFNIFISTQLSNIMGISIESTMCKDVVECLYKHSNLDVFTYNLSDETKCTIINDNNQELIFKVTDVENNVKYAIVINKENVLMMFMNNQIVFRRGIHTKFPGKQTIFKINNLTIDCSIFNQLYDEFSKKNDTLVFRTLYYINRLFIRSFSFANWCDNYQRLIYIINYFSKVKLTTKAVYTKTFIQNAYLRAFISRVNRNTTRNLVVTSGWLRVERMEPALFDNRQFQVCKVISTDLVKVKFAINPLSTMVKIIVSSKNNSDNNITLFYLWDPLRNKEVYYYQIAYDKYCIIIRKNRHFTFRVTDLYVVLYEVTISEHKILTARNSNEEKFRLSVASWINYDEYHNFPIPREEFGIIHMLIAENNEPRILSKLLGSVNKLDSTMIFVKENCYRVLLALIKLCTCTNLNPNLLHNPAFFEETHMLTFKQEVDCFTQVYKPSEEEVKDVEHMDKSLCNICYEKEKNIAFNCGHIISCEKCSRQINKCPLCRTHIVTRLRIYL